MGKPAGASVRMGQWNRKAQGWVPLALLGAVALSSVAALAQGTNDSQSAQIQQLMTKIDELQHRVTELEAAKGSHTSEASAPSAPSPVAEAEPEASSGHAMEVPGHLQMRIQGFSHAGFSASDEKGGTNSFFLGNFDLFITSRLSQKFSMLSELNFEAGEDNDFAVDLERLLLVYNANEHLQLSFGRYHTSIGFYNTAFHHGNWFETATERPFLFEFEDGGGPSPAHNVGVAATGLIYGGTLGLHYVAELGNGRPARHPQNSTVQNLFDENNGKSFNLGAYIRPTWARGLQAGVSVYHDHLIPDSGPRIEETIPAVHLVYQANKYELLNEVVLIHHSFDNTGQSLNMPGFYTELGREFGPVHPYFRYQYLNTSPRDPVIGDLGRRNGPSVGIRYDWSEYAALKLQYDRNQRRDLDAFNRVTALVAFTF